MGRVKELSEVNGAGKEMYELMKELYPICRSITGDGVRKTLRIIKRLIPIEIHGVPSGTKVFDWAIPKEWNITDAWVKNSKGEKIIDFKQSNLHVLNYSVPINKKMPLNELKEHLFTLPNHPDKIPYLTSYYRENWGFCIKYSQYTQLKEDAYEVKIDSNLTGGSLTYGELLIKGKRQEEFILSCYTCHPSLCNDNLSGVVLLTLLAKTLLHKKLEYSYRFLFIPETIGSITWLSLNEDKLKNVKHGLIATCTGDQGDFTYKKSRQGNAEVDKAAEKALTDSEQKYKIIDFFPSGSDERQFCSPAFNLPVGSLMRTMYGRYPEYHTSADNLNFIKSRHLEESLKMYLQLIGIIENNKKYINLNPKCEPQLGKRGLYGIIGGQKEQAINELAILWVLNQSDGNNSLLDIALRSGIKFQDIKNAADALVAKKLLKEVKEQAKNPAALL